MAEACVHCYLFSLYLPPRTYPDFLCRHLATGLTLKECQNKLAAVEYNRSILSRVENVYRVFPPEVQRKNFL